MLHSLDEIGLTQGESKVYLSLLRMGPSTTGPLASKANVSSSKVYKILDRLQKKGLVGQILRGNVKYFSAMEPKRLNDYLDEKERELDQKKQMLTTLIPQLEMEREIAAKPQGASVYEGLRGVTNLFRNIVDELKRGEVYHVIGGGYGSEIVGVKAFFVHHHKRRADKKIKLMMLANHNIQNTMVPNTRLYSSIRFLPQYLATNMEIVFYHHKAFIVLWTKEPKAFFMEDGELVQSFQTYFDALWMMAKG